MLFAKGVFIMHKDFLMRQIEFITTAIGEIIFFKPSSGYEVQSEVRQIESDLLYVLLCNMLKENNINGAENMLFDMLDIDNREHLAIAVDFYNQVSRMTDDELQNADFSRNEINRGLNDIMTLFGIPP